MAGADAGGRRRSLGLAALVAWRRSWPGGARGLAALVAWRRSWPGGAHWARSSSWPGGARGPAALIGPGRARGLAALIGPGRARGLAALVARRRSFFPNSRHDDIRQDETARARPRRLDGPQCGADPRSIQPLPTLSRASLTPDRLEQGRNSCPMSLSCESGNLAHGTARERPAEGDLVQSAPRQVASMSQR
jgi:hypothetical protein